ncbi:hypothetical protein Q3G72_027043 [Acer saccharum]|nr:hypothetical protein Q3G72_027043 [Acer saccharum]
MNQLEYFQLYNFFGLNAALRFLERIHAHSYVQEFAPPLHLSQNMIPSYKTQDRLQCLCKHPLTAAGLGQAQYCHLAADAGLAERWLHESDRPIPPERPDGSPFEDLTIDKHQRPPMEMHLASPWFSPLLVIGGRDRRPGRRMKPPFYFGGLIGGWMAADLERRFRPD